MTQAEKYLWLIKTIKDAGSITLAEISEKWRDNEELSRGEPLPRCTFKRWCGSISTSYGIFICCSKKNGYKYYISNPEAFEENKLRKWMVDSFAVGDIISGNKSIADRILVEEIPSGLVFLSPLLAAMRENRVIRMTYRSFGGEERTYDIEPYCVKLHKNRWYLLGRGEDEKLRVYGLDRIVKLEPVERIFRYPDDFDAEEFFSRFFGVVVGLGVKPCNIVVRAYGRHLYYMRSLPIHPSQREIKAHIPDDEDEAYADFQVYVAPSYDFIFHILSMGDMVEVISPENVRREVAEYVHALADMYKDCK